MEFIISESKFEQLKNKFLTSYVNDSDVSKFDSFIIINSDYEDDEYGIKQPHFEYDYSDGRLFVNQDIRNDFMNIFGLNKEKSNDSFKNWFENRFEVEVSFVE